MRKTRQKDCRLNNSGRQTPIQSGHDVTATALGQFAAKKLQRLNSLVQKIVGCLHNEPARVFLPGMKDALIDSLGLRRRLGPERVMAIVAIISRRRAQVDHSIITSELLLKRRTHVSPEVVRAGQ